MITRRHFVESRMTKGVNLSFSAGSKGGKKVNNLHATGSIILGIGEDATPTSSSVNWFFSKLNAWLGETAANDFWDDATSASTENLSLRKL